MRSERFLIQAGASGASSHDSQSADDVGSRIPVMDAQADTPTDTHAPTSIIHNWLFFGIGSFRVVQPH